MAIFSQYQQINPSHLPGPLYVRKRRRWMKPLLYYGFWLGVVGVLVIAMANSKNDLGTPPAEEGVAHVL